MATPIHAFGSYPSIIVTFINIAIQFYIIYRLIKSTYKKLPNVSITVAYISCISYSLYSFNAFIQSIYAISVSPENFDALGICIYRYLTPPCFITAKITMMLFYLVRLHNIFRGTAFGYNKRWLQCFGAFITIGFWGSAVCFIIISITGLTAAGDQISNFETFADCTDAIFDVPNALMMMGIGITSQLIVDLISSIVMLRLYLRKLIIMTLMFNTSEFKSNKTRAKGEKFMKLMLKTTNLLIMSVATEYLLIFVNATQIGEYWLGFNHSMNVLCIYLSFGGSSDVWYDKLCCCVDKYCSKCCGRLCFCCCLPRDYDIDATFFTQAEMSETSKKSEDTPKRKELEPSNLSSTEKIHSVSMTSNDVSSATDIKIVK